MTDYELQAMVMRVWTAVDSAYTHVSAQGVAAHKDCDTKRQHQLEKIAHELWQARHHVATAVHKSTIIEGESK